MTRNQRITNRYDAGNRIAAEIILAAVEKFGGEESCMVIWARAFLARYRRDRQAEAGPLFAAAAVRRQTG
jgi:hypothetical protein